MRPAPPKSGPHATALALAAGLLLAGLVVSRPLAREWAEGLPLTARAPADRAVLTYAAGDTLQLYYQLWLARDGLGGATPPFTDPYQFRVDGPRWNLPQSFLPLALPFLLLSPLGSHAAYNILVLLSFPAAGLAAYALVRRHGLAGPAAAAAGLAYALVPARLGPLFGGQPAGFAAAAVPLVLWGLDGALVGGRFRDGLLGGGAFLALAMLEPHYTYLTAALLVAYAPLRWLTAPPPRRLAGMPLLAFALLAAAGAGWLLMLRQAFLVGSIAEPGRGLAEVRLFSPGPAALLGPETYGGLGLAALTLAGVLLAREAPALRLFYGAVGAAGLILSLGPTLPGVPLYQALHRWAPLFGLIRNPEKFRLFVSLGAAVLAGFGVAALTRRLPPRRGRAAGLLLLAAIALGSAPWHGIAVTRLPDSPAFAALREQARRVLYLPIWPGDSAESAAYLHHVTRTRVPMVNGYSPLVPRQYVTDVFEPLQGLNAGDLGASELTLLRRLGVTHLVLDRAVFPPKASPFPSALTRDRLRASPAVAVERAAEPFWVFRLTDRPAEAGPRPTSPVGVFFEAEALLRETGAVVADAAASGGQVVAARAGAARPGFLVFGPYRLLPAGTYRATFRVRGAGLALDIAAERGQRRIAERVTAPTAEWTDVALDFALERARPVEFRVRWDGRGDAAVDWVLVVFAERPDPEWAFEVEALPHQLVGERADSAASGGVAAYADPVESRRIPLVTGPARRYPPGRYRVVLRARAAGPAAGPLLRLTVTEPAGRVLAARTVQAAELPPGAYREVALAFTLSRAAVIECPVEYLGATGVYFDRLAVVPE